MIFSIESKNNYYIKGLEILINELISEYKITKSFIVRSCDNITNNEVINVVLRDSSISVNLFKKNSHLIEMNSSINKFTLNTPFVCKNKKMTDIRHMIEKVIFIANLNGDDFLNDDFYKETGLKKHEQLSLTETKIMLLIGRGNNVNVISRQLNRSEKTINVHWRNASRKMKLDNKVDFYNYAKFIVACRRNERKTLCL